jgi:O-antigen ligase
VLSGLCLGSWVLAALTARPEGQLVAALRKVGPAWAVAATLSALIGLAQYFGVAPALGDWVNPGQLGEAYGNLRQRNHFATLTNLGLAAVLWRYVGEPPRGGSTGHTFGALDWAAMALAALLAVGNAASGSRTGLLQLVLLGGCVFVWRDEKLPLKQSAQVRMLFAAMLFYALAVIFFPVLIGSDPQVTGMPSRFNDDGSSCQSRRVLWSNVLHLIAQKPVFGWGWGELDYAHFITLYPGQRFCGILDNAHNLPLQLAVELGVPLAFFVSTLATWLIVRKRPWHETDPSRQLAWAVLALIGLHSMLEYPLWYGPFQMAVALAVMMLWRTPGVHATNALAPATTMGLAAMWTAGAALALVLAGCAYAGWDYWRISQIYIAPDQRAPAYLDDTLHKIQASWLFKDYVRYAELTTTPLTSENSAYMHALALEMLHFSPEPKVARLVIESARLQGRGSEVAFYVQRFRAAFPDERI